MRRRLIHLALSAASSKPKQQYTFAATLWWTIVRLSSLTMSIPNSWPECSTSLSGAIMGTYNDVVCLQLELVALYTLDGQPLAVDESAIGGFDIADENLERQSPFHPAQHTLPPCSHTSACVRERTLESKYALRSPGIVFWLV